MTDLELAYALMHSDPERIEAALAAARQEGEEQASGEIHALRKALHDETMKRLASAEEMRERAAQTMQDEFGDDLFPSCGRADMTDLGRLIAAKRVGQGVRAAALEVGVSPATLSRVENGHMPDLETFAKICQWLDRDPREFLGMKARKNCGYPGMTDLERGIDCAPQPPTLTEIESALAAARLKGAEEMRERAKAACHERSQWAASKITNENADAMWATYSNACDDCLYFVAALPLTPEDA